MREWMLEATLGIEPRIGVLQTPALPLGYVAGKRFLLLKGYPARCRAANSPRLSVDGRSLPNRGALYHAPSIIGVSGEEKADILA